MHHFEHQLLFMVGSFALGYVVCWTRGRRS